MPTRRRMFRSTAVLATGGIVGAGLTSRIATQTQAAEAGLDVIGDDIEIRSGEIDALWLDLAVEWSYAVPSGEQPDRSVVEVLAGVDEASMTVVETIEESEAFLESGGDGTISVDLLDAGVFDADALVPSEGGETVETTVHVAIEYRLEDTAGLTIAAASDTDTATVAIAKSDYDPSEHGDIAGSGAITVELS